MRPDELIQLVRHQPFAPLRIHITGGGKYDVRHPDQLIVLRGRLDIGVGSDPECGAVEAVEHVSLLHVVRVEELQPAFPRASDGSDGDGEGPTPDA